jgi:molybdate transport system regulatory protein
MADRLDALRRAVLESADDTAGALALRTSMRNLLRCHVERVLPADGLVGVRLATAAGDRLASSITAESAELLGLHPGLPVLALFKATAMRVEAAAEAAVSADLTPPGEPPDNGDNRLAGTVARPPAEAGGELSLALASGERITGFRHPAGYSRPARLPLPVWPQPPWCWPCRERPTGTPHRASTSRQQRRRAVAHVAPHERDWVSVSIRYKMQSDVAGPGESRVSARG